MFTLENLTNASIIIRSENEKLIIDPWFTDGIYLGTWHNFPRISDEDLSEALSNVDVCMYTHLHKDHFDIETAKKYFSKNTKFLIPKVFGWQVINATLQKNGFRDVNVLECSVETYETHDFRITAVPPLNVTGLEAQNENNMSIDGGFSLVHKKNEVKCVFLADDNLYSEKRVKENLEVISDPDLIAFAYSGFASDYPFKYDLPNDEMVNICNQNEENRFWLQIENLSLINPKFILPYSSEFVAVGNHAKNWREVLPQVWTSNKKAVAKRYADALNVKSCALYPKDLVSFSENGSAEIILKNHPEDNNYGLSNLLVYADSIEQDQVAYKNSGVDKHQLSLDLQEASANFKKALARFHLKPKQNIIFNSSKCYLGAIDTSGEFSDKVENAMKAPYLQLTIDEGILSDILHSREHWDDACLSMRLNWKRVPNEFCGDTMNALYYVKL